MATRTGIPLLVLIAALAGGCAKTYAPPKPNEPAAIVKLKFTYNRASAIAALPAGRTSDGISATLHLVEEKEPYGVYRRFYPEALKGSAGGELEIDAVRLHPGRPVTLVANVSAVWTTQSFVTVTRFRTVPRQQMQQTSVYDSYSKTTRYQSRLATVYLQEPYQTQEMVTQNHASGCSAKAALTPEADRVYLIDFSSPVIDAGCGAAIYRQALAPGGFRLEPVQP